MGWKNETHSLQANHFDLFAVVHTYYMQFVSHWLAALVLVLAWYISIRHNLYPLRAWTWDAMVSSVLITAEALLEYII